MIDRTIMNNIRLLEKHIELAKTKHMAGRISAKDARKLVSGMQKKIDEYLCSLPEHEKELYLIKREHGHGF